MYKIAAVGDKDSVAGFAAIGIEIFVETEQKSAARLIRRLAEEDYGVIFITEQLASLVQNETDKLAECVTPAVIPIPGCRGNSGMGMNNLKRFVEKAVGSDILGE